MKRLYIVLSLALAFCAAVYPFAVQGAGDLTKQQPIELRVQLGNKDNALRFFPDTI